MHIPDGFLPAGLRLSALSGHPSILPGLSDPLCCLPAAAVPAAASPASLFLPGTDQAFRAETDQIRPPGLCERFMHQVIIFRVPVLDQRALHGLFMGIFADVNRFAVSRIHFRIIHDRRW